MIRSDLSSSIGSTVGSETVEVMSCNHALLSCKTRSSVCFCDDWDGEGFLERLARLVAWLEWGLKVVKERCASPLRGSGGWVTEDEAISDGGAERGGGRCHPRW